MHLNPGSNSICNKQQKIFSCILHMRMVSFFEVSNHNLHLSHITTQIDLKTTHKNFHCLTGYHSTHKLDTQIICKKYTWKRRLSDNFGNMSEIWFTIYLPSVYNKMQKADFSLNNAFCPHFICHRFTKRKQRKAKFSRKKCFFVHTLLIIGLQ